MIAMQPGKSKLVVVTMWSQADHRQSQLQWQILGSNVGDSLSRCDHTDKELELILLRVHADCCHGGRQDCGER